MIRAYSLLAAAAVLANGPMMAPLIERYQLAMAHDRPTPPAATASVAFAADSEIGRDGLYHLTGFANQKPISFVIDTGASVTVLTATDAARLGLSLGRADPPAQLRTAGGATAMTWRSLAHLDIAGSHFTNIDVVVTRGGPDHSLLGQDILSLLGTITITGSRLAITRPAT